MIKEIKGDPLERVARKPREIQDRYERYLANAANNPALPEEQRKRARRTAGDIEREEKHFVD